MAEHDVAHAQRRREHRVVLPIPLDRRQHRPARLERRDLHRRRRHQTGRDELEVRDAVREIGRPVDEHAEPDAEREQVDDRCDDARDRRSTPDAPVLREEELERPESESAELIRRGSGRSGGGTRPRACCGGRGRSPGRGRARASRARRRHRRRCRGARGPAATRPARRGPPSSTPRSSGGSSSKRSSTTSRVE